MSLGKKIENDSNRGPPLQKYSYDSYLGKAHLANPASPLLHANLIIPAEVGIIGDVPRTKRQRKENTWQNLVSLRKQREVKINLATNIWQKPHPD